MATLYLNFKQRCESPAADAHEKITIGATDTVSTNASAKRSTIELLTDTVCLVDASAAPSTSTGKPFYVYPGVRTSIDVGAGVKVAVKAA